jgi:hypothetical protein
VSYKDYRKNRDEVKTRAGYAKIVDLCKVARQQRHNWAGIDTCCIDKRSGAELSDVINSMWNYYSNAEVCYVYLHGYQPSAAVDGERLGACEWFTRGWTVQELIAPHNVSFYNANWGEIGHKCARGARCLTCELLYGTSLIDDLARFTGIPSKVLLDAGEARRCSIAKRMSWASK